MLLRASTSLSLLPPPSEEKKPSLTASSSLLRLRRRTGFGPAVAMAGRNEANPRPITGVVFQPFEELKNELSLVPASNDNSLARHKYAEDCEAAINEQINVEYNVSYVYHAMFAYFDRDNVALKGLAKFCKESSEEEREHAEKLMKYQNKRGGRVKLQTILMPANEFDHHEKGDALSGSILCAYMKRVKSKGHMCTGHYLNATAAMELALSLEKLTHEKLLNMHNVAQQSKDVQMVDFIETEFLGEQVEAIKKISAYVAQLRRVGKGHGVWHFNQMLLHEEEVVAA